MSPSKVLNTIDELQNEINSFGKLSNETLNRIHYKFRLDWNYHSNAIEGNSLTRQETRSVMINNVTVEGKPLKDVLEIRGHDEVISQILKIGKGELKLSEKRIKEIHKAIMREDDPELVKKIGEWKNEDNHVINYKNEKFEFVSYRETPDAMHKLLNWLNENYDRIINRKANAIHPVKLAFEFHIRYVSIHPFYDGNGRTARILTNLILIAFGYPPLIVKVEDKNAYNQYLADIQAYGGDNELFMEFLGKRLVHSQEIVLNAVKGISIEEPEDLDKKISLLERELNAIDPNQEIKERFSPELFLKMYSGWISELLMQAIPIVQKFNKFFTGTKHRIFINNPPQTNVLFVNEQPEKIISDLYNQIKSVENSISINNNLRLSLLTHYGTFVKGGLNTFGCNYGIDIEIGFIKFWIETDLFTEEGQPGKKMKLHERLLHQDPTPKEIETLLKVFGETIYTHIDYNTKKRGIR